jgi:RNA polymerase sigma factor (sigma-70 family)
MFGILAVRNTPEGGAMKKAKKYPNNGFVDSFGKLTPAAGEWLVKFQAKFPQPIVFLKSKYRSIGNAVESQIRSGYYSMEDFNGQVMVEVSGGIRQYDPDKGTSVITYLCERIRTAGSHMVDKFARSVSTTSYHADAGGDSFDDIIPEMGVVDHFDEALEPWGQFADRMRYLTTPQRQVLSLRYISDMSRTEVADKLSVSRQRVREIENLALHKLNDDPTVPTHRRRVETERHNARVARIIEMYGPKCLDCGKRAPARLNGRCGRCSPLTKQDN